MTGYLDGISSGAQKLLSQLPKIDQIGESLQNMEMSEKAKEAVGAVIGLLKNHIIIHAGDMHIGQKMFELVKEFFNLTSSQVQYMKGNFWAVGAGAVMLIVADRNFLQSTSQEESKQTKDYIRIALKVAGYGALAYSMWNTLTKLGDVNMHLKSSVSEIYMTLEQSKQISALVK